MISSRSLPHIAAAAAALLLSSPLAAQPTPVAATAAPRQADQRLKTLYEGYADWTDKEFGTITDAKGHQKPAAYLPKIDPATQAQRGAYLTRLLAELNAIPEAQLSPGERDNAAVLRNVVESALADARFRQWEMPVNSDSNFWTYLDDGQNLDDAADYRRYIARMRDIPRYFAEQTANMRAGLARGFTPPAVTLAGRDGSIRSFTAPVAENAFLAPFKTMPPSIAAAEQATLRAEGRAAIEQAVIPAYRALLAFYRDDYVPGARKTVSARDLPDGDAYYRAQVREYTTLDMPPEAIRAVGLKEVARIDGEMRQTMRDSGFKGCFPAFLTFLKTDPRFFARTPDELLGVSAYVAKRVDGKLKDLFETLPRRRFTIVPVAPALAPFYTAGRGGLESCQINTFRLRSRPLYNIPALTLHECSPGHSLQAALAEEGPALPRFRQHIYFSGYGEGWGLYSEWLGIGMGIYRTPYENFGRLSYEMWRAARLVIDTGIHLDGWSRQRAIDYLAAHTALSQHEVETEVDRYISWPGQALSYKLGELTIRRLRAAAEAALGPRFDQRKFHDVLLSGGAVPLPVIETRVRAFIAASQAG
ncbi:MAG: DUF885 family protein [Sphingomicrobium sp.]|nr:DUF885 family protein [Sphingomonadales bacterium]